MNVLRSYLLVLIIMVSSSELFSMNNANSGHLSIELQNNIMIARSQYNRSLAELYQAQLEFEQARTSVGFGLYSSVMVFHTSRDEITRNIQYLNYIQKKVLCAEQGAKETKQYWDYCLDNMVRQTYGEQYRLEWDYPYRAPRLVATGSCQPTTQSGLYHQLTASTDTQPEESTITIDADRLKDAQRYIKRLRGLKRKK